jgi:hypothetical protein
MPPSSARLLNARKGEKDPAAEAAIRSDLRKGVAPDFIIIHAPTPLFLNATTKSAGIPAAYTVQVMDHLQANDAEAVLRHWSGVVEVGGW